MTNEEIILLARSTIQNGRDLVDVMNNADHGKTSGGRSDYGGEYLIRQEITNGNL